MSLYLTIFQTDFKSFPEMTHIFIVIEYCHLLNVSKQKNEDLLTILLH